MPNPDVRSSYLREKWRLKRGDGLLSGLLRSPSDGDFALAARLLGRAARLIGEDRLRAMLSDLTKPPAPIPRAKGRPSGPKDKALIARAEQFIVARVIARKPFEPTGIAKEMAREWYREQGLAPPRGLAAQGDLQWKRKLQEYFRAAKFAYARLSMPAPPGLSSSWLSPQIKGMTFGSAPIWTRLDEAVSRASLGDNAGGLLGNWARGGYENSAPEPTLKHGIHRVRKS